MSSVHMETSTETKDTLEAVMALLSMLHLSSADCVNLASDLLSRNPDEGGTLHVIDSQMASSASSSPISSNEEQETTTETLPPCLPVWSLPAAAATAVASTSMVTVAVDEEDSYAEVEAAIAVGSVLHMYMDIYFNVPMDDKTGVTIYYITRGQRIGVFYGWNNVGSLVQGVSRALYGKVDSVDDGIDIVKSVIETGAADIPLDEALSKEQQAIVAESWRLRQHCLAEKFCNDLGGSKVGRVANAVHTATVNKMLGHIMKKDSAERNSHVLKPWEMYSKIHCQDKVKDAVIAEQHSSSKPDRKSVLGVIKQRTKQAFEEESEEVRDKVFAAVEAMKEKKCAEIQEAKEQNKSDTNKEVQTYPDFTQSVMAPYTQFVECVFPEAALLTRAKHSIPSTSISGPVSGISALPPQMVNTANHVLSFEEDFTYQNDDTLGGITTDISPIFYGPTLPAHVLNTASQIISFGQDFTCDQNDYHSAAASQNHNPSDINFFSDFPPEPFDTAKDAELTQPLVLLPAPPRPPNTAYPLPSLVQFLENLTLEPLIEQGPPLNYGISSPPQIRHQFHNLGGFETTTNSCIASPASFGIGFFPAQSALLPAPPPVSVSVPEKPALLPLLPSASASFPAKSVLLPAPPPVMNSSEQEGRSLKRRKTNHAAVEGHARLPPVGNSPVVKEGRGKRKWFQSKCTAAANDFGQICALRKGKGKSACQ
ncbi:hypothetical protein F4604DRAFT_1918951 [Suillus subluteus]|nr:hypothetical protein F4604DRAFT_1918951 [Suillus subluteus]